MADSTTNVSGHPAPLPAPNEKRWVVIVMFTPEFSEDLDEPEVLYILDAKTGGVASIYDPETWSDENRASNYAAMMRISEHPQHIREYVEGFVDCHGQLCLPCGHPVARC